MPNKYKTLSIEERFFNKINKTDSCWLWKDFLSVDGYGFLKINKKMIRAHRASYELFKGKIPYGLCVMHKCDIPSCVNPDHLILGTQTENIKDRDIKLRTGRGEKNRHAKLKEFQVIEIKKLISEGMRNKEIAKIYSVNPMTISSIRHNKQWKFVKI